jgi:hypothetical protein
LQVGTTTATGGVKEKAVGGGGGVGGSGNGGRGGGVGGSNR